ncbi:MULTISPECIES: tetratricopeptide repeat protein [unclassified Streptomyces]|uniref:tetratricopeptide repeat protein n=1 Tax=unclassified Streptomyces TaxID=2593676 RepID=UPI00168B7B1A|nr:MULTISPECIES: tetratricopeptide repeat protein [unclassified Streptomyces]MBD3004029.1 tetratricopeptide repeat protein [Streptomyces sp. 5-10]
MTMPAGGDITVDWVHIRDTIQVNDALLAEIRAELTHLPPEARLALIAREVVHDPQYVLTGLPGHPLVVVAETYRGNGGALDNSGASGAAGAYGATGPSGVGYNGMDGGPGGPGGTGGTGGAATPVTVLAHTITDLRIAARGGQGGQGGTGGLGGRGKDGGRPPNRPDPPDSIPGGNGGSGGPGGTGGVGGPAAEIVVETATYSGLSLDGAGGAPGAAGSGGRGGTGGRHGGENGPGGPPGAAGPAAGPGVEPRLLVHSDADWWGVVRSRLGGRAAEWAHYRTTVGEFLFRSYAPGLPNRSGHRDTAAHEFDRALALDPGQERAAELSRYIATNLSPIGQPYNLDLMPDFPNFEGVVVDYDAIVHGRFTDAMNLLLSVLSTGQKRELLKTDMEQLAGMRDVLVLEEKAAGLALEGAEGRQKIINQQIEEVNQQIQQVREEMTRQRMQFPPGNDLGPLVGAAIAVAAAASAIASAGATAVAFVAAAEAIATSSASFEGFDTATGRYGEGAYLINYIDWSDPTHPKPKPEAAKVMGGLSDLVKKSAKFIEAGRTIAELASTTIDGKLESRERDLVARHLDLVRQLGVQILEVQQKQLLKRAAEAKIARNEADLEAMRRLDGDWASDITVLSATARRLVTQTQFYVDVLIRYSFYAHRALDIFTFSNEAPAYSFDWGHLHPDEVENAYQPLARGDASRVPGLFERYHQSWNAMLKLEPLRTRYMEYKALLDHTVRFVNITAPEVLTALRTTGRATFTVSLDGFPAAFSELKIDRVHLGLVGATAETPAVVLFLQHGGAAVNRRRSGTEERPSGRPLTATVEATFDRSDPTDPADPRPSYWGRSPATTWTVTVEPTSAREGGLKLDRLSALQLTIWYWYFTSPTGTAQPVAPMPVRADYDGDGVVDEAIWSSAEGSWQIRPSSGAPPRSLPWGRPGDIPVPADYDGDGKAELAVFRPDNRKLYTTRADGGPAAVHYWRTADYVPRPTDLPRMRLLANTFRQRAAVLTNAGRHAEAVEVQFQARDAYLQLAAVSAPARRDVAQTLVILGMYLSRVGRHDEAITIGQKGVAEYRAIGDEEHVAWALGNLAALFYQAGRPEEAAETQRRAVAAYRVLAAANPAFEAEMAKTLVFLGMYLQHAGRHEEAVAAGRDAVAVYRRREDLPDLAWALGNLGALLQSAGRPGAGADAWREARDIYQRLDATAPGTYRPLLAMAAYRQAALLVADGRRAEALAPAEQAVALYEELGAAHPGTYVSETEAARKLRDSLRAG